MKRVKNDVWFDFKSREEGNIWVLNYVFFVVYDCCFVKIIVCSDFDCSGLDVVCVWCCGGVFFIEEYVMDFVGIVIDCGVRIGF